MFRAHFPWPVALLVGLVALAGCDREAPTNPVHGPVTLDGQPLPMATVQFLAQDPGGRDALGTTDADAITATLTNAGNDAQPLVDIDSATGTQLVQVENFQVATANTGAVPTLITLPQLNISTDDGDDTITITGRTDGATT